MVLGCLLWGVSALGGMSAPGGAHLVGGVCLLWWGDVPGQGVSAPRGDVCSGGGGGVRYSPL